MLEVCLSGVDGAGKSVQTSFLLVLFRRLGYRVAYVWLRWFAVTTYILYLYARVFRRTIKVWRNGYVATLHPWWIDPVLKKLYPYLALSDLLLVYHVRKFVLWLKGIDVVVYDRGFIDLITDLIWETRRADFLKNNIIWTMLSKVLAGMKIIVLLVDPREATRRKRDIVSLKEIAFKKTCYEVFARHLAVPVVNTTNKTPQETAETVARLLEPSFGKRVAVT